MCPLAYVDDDKEKVKKSCSCPHETVTAPLGGTVTFKCPITWEPGETKTLQVSWLKKLKSDGEVQVHCQNGGDEEVTQNEDYIGRTSLCENWVKDVNGALTLTNVKISDAGDYICFVTHLAEDIKRTMCCEVALKVESDR
ncbi:myelin-oligodendrocyte glycoprotein-like [Bombina bombina]|uniref:myelin-oligodendrocyte glycoprotein-like n=1 Tax=Bombina bombina TaxID=8345 RepID=UPI00235A4EAD|nr:myelin-oligodendrocyte glycoprotein-like [Bombina bombina]